MISSWLAEWEQHPSEANIALRNLIELRLGPGGLDELVRWQRSARLVAYPRICAEPHESAYQTVLSTRLRAVADLLEELFASATAGGDKPPPLLRRLLALERVAEAAGSALGFLACIGGSVSHSERLSEARVEEMRKLGAALAALEG